MIGASFLLNIIFLFTGASLLDAGTVRVQEKYISHNEYAKDKVVILPIEGIIMESEDGFVKRAIDTAMKDDNVKAMVLRVDSPGGSVSGSDYIYHHLCELVRPENRVEHSHRRQHGQHRGQRRLLCLDGRRPRSPSTIFAEPTCFTGSIGVIMPHYNVAEFMDEYGLVDDSVRQQPVEGNGQPHQSDDARGEEDLSDPGRRQLRSISRKSSVGRPQVSRRTRTSWTIWLPVRSTRRNRP